MAEGRDDSLQRFAARVAIAAGIVAATAMLWRLSSELLILFAAILLAVAWRAAARPLEARLKLPKPVAMGLAALVLAALFGSSLATFGGRLLAQYDEMGRDIPRAISEIRQAIEAHPLGNYVESVVATTDISAATAPLAAHVATFMGAVSESFAHILVLLLGGVCFALAPKTYVEGAVALAPAPWREGLSRFLDRAGAMLQQWLVVQLFVVVVNAALSFAGLSIAGVEAPLALATLSGALAFIPFVGSWIAIAFGALTALPQGLDQGIYAALAIGGASFIEGYLLTPVVQSRALALPPAVLIFSMSMLGALFGLLGVVLAAPLTVVAAAALAAMRDVEPTA